MLRIDLARLAREHVVAVQGSIPADSALWEGSELAFASDVQVDLVASATTDGGVVARGTLSGRLVYECARCLDPLDLPLQEEVTLVFLPESDEAVESDSDVYPLPAGAAELVLDEAIRQEVILSQPRFLLPELRDDGSCTRCGRKAADLLPRPQDRGTDPRWNVLKSLLNE